MYVMMSANMPETRRKPRMRQSGLIEARSVYGFVLSRRSRVDITDFVNSSDPDPRK
jgi:hypothetical protein